VLPTKAGRDSCVFDFAILYREALGRAHRLAVRTAPSHGANRGSIPLGRTNTFNHLAKNPAYPSNIRRINVGELPRTEPIDSIAFPATIGKSVRRARNMGGLGEVIAKCPANEA
jgi:hypothetical protein